MYIFYSSYLPNYFFNEYKKINGRNIPSAMHWFYDLIDWLGCLPFEVRKPEDHINCFFGENFNLTYLRTGVGKSGCNEYTFRRNTNK